MLNPYNFCDVGMFRTPIPPLLSPIDNTQSKMRKSPHDLNVANYKIRILLS